MANQSPPNDTQLVPIAFQPGIRRDGTKLETKSYRDGLWCRFFQGRPRKIGGYREITALGLDDVYSAHVYPRNDIGWTHMGSVDGVQQIQISGNTGLGTALIDRTPSAYSTVTNGLWQFGSFYDDAAGTQSVQILGFVAPNLLSIDSDAVGTLYTGELTASASITGAAVWPPANPGAEPNAPSVSGGFAVTQPFLFMFGSDGFVAWSDENLPGVFGTRSAGNDRITDNKIVAAKPVRGSQVPSLLFWSLNSLIKATYSLGPTIFSFNTITDETSILSSRSPVEANGIYYWPGIEHFVQYDGVVRELPNNDNLDWFYSNLNWEYRQRVWSIKLPQWGEIWWCFPFGTATECTHAVIYNYRDNVWYDTELPSGGRLGGYNGSVFKWPVMGCGSNKLWLQEFGQDKISGSAVAPIQSYYETADIAYPTSGPMKQGWMGLDRRSKTMEIEPDFKDQVGDLTFTLKRREHAQTTSTIDTNYTAAVNQEKMQMNKTGRLNNIKVESNVVGGFYQAGEILLHVGPDDGR